MAKSAVLYHLRSSWCLPGMQPFILHCPMFLKDRRLNITIFNKGSEGVGPYVEGITGQSDGSQARKVVKPLWLSGETMFTPLKGPLKISNQVTRQTCIHRFL